MAYQCEVRNKNGTNCGANAQRGKDVCVFSRPDQAVRRPSCEAGWRSRAQRIGMQSVLRRIERAEEAVKTQGVFLPHCICFPTKERPFFGLPIEHDIAAQVKCPLHGERFKPQNFQVYVSEWMRVKIWPTLWRKHSEQYRKAWFASFPPELWPAREEYTSERGFLVLKDGTRIQFQRSSSTPASSGAKRLR